MTLIGEIGGLLWTVLAFVTALSIIVAVHEYGHYIVGRWCGIKAEVFSLGFGPRLISRRDRRGTLWQVAAIPLGGYVRFLGDANAASAGTGVEVDRDLRRQSLTGAPIWARFATVAAGPIFNFVLSILIFGGMVIWQGVPTERVEIGRLMPLPPAVTNELRPGDQVIAIEGRPVATWRDLRQEPREGHTDLTGRWTVQRDGARLDVTAPDPALPIIGGVMPRSAASAAGLRAGDVVLSVDGQAIQRFAQISEVVTAAQGRPVVFQVWRDGVGEADYALAATERDLPLAEGGFERRWLVGLQDGSFYAPVTHPASPIQALQAGIDRTWNVISSSITGLWAMITGQIGTCNLGGAISIAETTSEAASAGGANFIWWLGVLSAAIGFLNLLPIPVLDGGHLVFFAYEGVTGRPASDRVVNALTVVGLALVLTLMVFGLSNDLLCP